MILKINNARYNKNCNYNTFLKNKVSCIPDQLNHSTDVYIKV